MMSLRDAMRREAGRIWRDKARAERLGLFLNEETITETLLLHLATEFQGNGFWVRPFTKARETRNGADWEFWFVQGHKSVGLRVQAKRLFPSGKYQSLIPGGQQADKLIRKSGNCYPVFAFYNDSRAYFTSLPDCLCGDYYAPSYRGCTLAPADVVRSCASHDANILANQTIPLHCLLCEFSSNKGVSLPQRIAGLLNERFPLSRIVGDGSQRYDVVETPEEFRVDIGQMNRMRPIRSLDSDHVFEEPYWLEGYLKARTLAGVALFTAVGR